MDLLSKPERELLEWLEKQDSPVLVDKLLTAPSYDPERCRLLVDRGLVSPVIMGLTATAYKISDKGRAALESSNLTLDSNKRSKIALAVSIIAAIISLAAFVRSFFV
jgi:hypothetical protein